MRDKLPSAKAVFNASQFRDAASFGTNGAPSDIEDRLPVDLYLRYFNAAFGKQLAGKVITQADLQRGLS